MDIGHVDQRRDVAHRVKGMVLHQMRIGGMGADDEAKGMAIGIGAHNGFRANQPCRAGAVFNHHVLAQRFLQGRRDHACNDIRGAGRRPGYNEADGPCGDPGALRARNAGRGQGRCSSSQK